MTENEKNLIKAAFGTYYAQPICDWLSSIAIYNEKGNPFSTASIRMMVGGFAPNEEIEEKILAHAKRIKAQKDRKQRSRAEKYN